MKNNKINYLNYISNKYLNPIYSKKLNKECDNILKDIISNLNNDNSFYFLSNKFKLNFSQKDINKFKRFKTIVIIGMGGSILGPEAIYNFLKGKIKKHLLFLNNINEEEINELKKKDL